jgi:hypothetical protein
MQKLCHLHRIYPFATYQPRRVTYSPHGVTDDLFRGYSCGTGSTIMEQYCAIVEHYEKEENGKMLKKD